MGSGMLSWESRVKEIRVFPDAEELARAAADGFIQQVQPKQGRLVWLMDRAASSRYHFEKCNDRRGLFLSKK